MSKSVEPRQRAAAGAIAAAIERLFAAFPHAKPDMLEATIQVYADALADIAPAKLRAAVDELIRSERFLPSIAVVRERAEAIRDQAARPTTPTGERPFISWNSRGEGLRRDGEGDQEMIWRIRVRHFATHPRPYWPDNFGPRPGQAGCGAPAGILAEFGYSASPAPSRAAPRPAQRDPDAAADGMPEHAAAG